MASDAFWRSPANSEMARTALPHRELGRFSSDQIQLWWADDNN